MSIEDMHVAALVREVEELLSVNSVGLYEFIWLLRTWSPAESDEQRRCIARKALSSLIEDGGVRLVLLRWPNEQPVGELSLENLPETAWDDPVNCEDYVALAALYA